MDSGRVLDIFKEITTIPRESGHEEKMIKWLVKWADDRHLACKTDDAGNVLITREAAPGKEDIPALVLQSHMDMVCERNSNSTHDFSKDPINYVIEDGWMIAKETTLGADDGIGIAATLALLEDPTPTGKLEALFTTSEETGLDGAMALKSGFFTAKTLINLDSEDEGQLFIGCAGGLNTTASFSYAEEIVPEQWEHLRLTLSGAQGGHSGDDINKGRANAVQLMGRFLATELKNRILLVEICGGGKANAIARECTAVIAVESNADALARRFMEFGNNLKEEFHQTDPGIEASFETLTGPVAAVCRPVGDSLIRVLAACPHGMMAMSQDIAGLVQTSTNLASVKMDGNGHIVVTTSQRSASTSERRGIAARVSACFELAGAEVEHKYEYPGWNPDLNSHILSLSVDAYRTLFNEEPLVLAIHAGLECGQFLNTYPGLDMISFGPTLRGVHAPGEKLEIASMDRFVRLLEYLVVNFN